MATADERRKQAAALARQKAKESQNRQAGKTYLKTDLKRLEVKGGKSTLVSVIPYVVKERHHPDNIKPGELWYKRPFKLHRNVGAGDDSRPMTCPKTFNPRSSCAPCNQVGELSKDWEKNKDLLSDLRAKNRDLLLVYDHDAKEIRYMDEPYGGGNLAGFGMLLDARIANPRKEEWASFWLDGDDGMALDIMWQTSKSGSMEWTKPVSIDFVPRKDAPVPKDIWKQAVELSELLYHTTSKEIEAAFYEIPDDDDEVQPQEEPPPEPETDPEPEPNQEEDENVNFDGMGKEELLAFAKENDLKDQKGRLISKFFVRNKEEEIRTLVTASWEKFWAEAAEAGKEEDETGCPSKGVFGKDFNELDGCANCPEKIYNACSDAAS